MKKLLITCGIAAMMASACSPAPVTGYESEQGYMQPVHSSSYYAAWYMACLTFCTPTPVYRVYVAPVGYPSYYRPWYPSPTYRPSYSSTVIIHHEAPVYHVYQKPTVRMAAPAGPNRNNVSTPSTRNIPSNDPAKVSGRPLPPTFRPTPPTSVSPSFSRSSSSSGSRRR